jgi:hypothetical protein
MYNMLMYVEDQNYIVISGENRRFPPVATRRKSERLVSWSSHAAICSEFDSTRRACFEKYYWSMVCAVRACVPCASKVKSSMNPFSSFCL